MSWIPAEPKGDGSPSEGAPKGHASPSEAPIQYNTKHSTVLSSHNNNTVTQPTKAVVVSDSDFQDLWDLIPETEQSYPIKNIILEILKTGHEGFVIAKSNIMHAIRHHKSKGEGGKNQTLGGHIFYCLKHDCAEGERQKAVEKEAAAARLAEQEAATKAAREAEQDALTAETVSALVAWDQLPEETRAALEAEADWLVSKNKIVPIPSVCRTQTLARMYYMDQLQLPSI